MSFIFILMLMGSIALDGCNSDEKQICAHQFTRFGMAVDSAILALGPWKDDARVPASQGLEKAALAEVDRSAWQDWALGQIKAVQGAMDRVEKMPSMTGARSELSAVETELVSFHGYATQGRITRMLQSLQRMRDHSSLAEKLGCPL